MKNYQKINAVISTAFIVVCLTVIASFFLMDWQWLTSTNYQLHEMMGLPILFGYVLIPLGIVFGLIYFIKYQTKTVKADKKPVNAILNLSSVISLTICIAAVTFFTGRSTTSGWEPSLQKYEQNFNYYIVLNGNEVPVSEPQYNLIVNNEEYMYSYMHNNWLGNDYYRLEYLKILDE